MIINVRGTAGGVGTTTVAAATAIQLTESGWNVSLVDMTGTGDAFVVLGVSVPEDDRPVRVRTTGNGATLDVVAGAIRPDDADAVVIDWGVCPDRAMLGTVVTVTTSRYSALRRAMSLLPDIGIVVVRTADGDALRMDDVQHAVGRTVRTVEMPTDVRVARALDAGLFTLFTSRRPMSIGSTMVRLEEAIFEAQAVAS